MMNIKEILHSRLEKLYSGNSGEIISAVGSILKPELTEIVNIFYDELLKVPEIFPILENTIVRKNLRESLHVWIRSVFSPHKDGEIEALITRQKVIGAIHANISVNLNFFNHGIGILKREIYRRIQKDESLHFPDAFLPVSEMFDILLSVISESYFSSEMVHENNELSLKVKGLTQNTAIECERLRSMLLDWLRNTLTFLYQSPELHLNSLPKLQYANFGLWVIYKADFLSHPLNISGDLKRQILEIDEALFHAARCRMEKDENAFFDAVNKLNDTVSKSSWFISSIVDQALELDTGMDPLTRLFNRRYLNTILRRQTDISTKQGFPYSILMLDIDFFKKVNDEYGHDSGDAVLKQFSEIMLLSVRASDFIFRYGGEEFLIILGNVDEEGALNIAEKIRKKCEQHQFLLSGNRRIHATCSIGIGIHDGHPDFNRLVKKADMALYQAKERGRNRVRI